MDTVKISGVSPVFDGDYPLDLSYFTNRELHLIKTIAGVRAGELEDALAAGDTDIIVAIAAIAAKRNGKDIPVDFLWDAPAGQITLETTEEEAMGDVGPPSPTLSESAASDGVDEKPPTSGSPSNGTGGDPRVIPLSSTGSRG